MLLFWPRPCPFNVLVFFQKFSGQQYLRWMTHEILRAIVRTPSMRACSSQRGVRVDWQLLEHWGLYFCLQLSQLPHESGTDRCVRVCVCPHAYVSVSAVHQCMHPWNLSCAWIPRCHSVTSHLHWLPEGTAVRQAILAEGTQVTATPVINDIALSGTPVWAHCGAFEGL